MTDPRSEAPPKRELGAAPEAPPGARRRALGLESRGVELSVLEWGAPEHPLAVLHHANGFCAAQWAEVAEALQDRFRVVAVDARGHGHSPLPPGGVAPETLSWVELREDLVAVGARLLEEAGRSKIALAVGHSFGGTLSLAAAAREPDRYQAVLALDPVILKPHITGPGRGDQLAARSRRRRSVFASRAEARESFEGKPLFEGWTDRALDLYVDFGLGPTRGGELALRCPPAVEAAIFESAVEFDMLEEAGRIEARAGVLWAARGHFPRAIHAALVEPMPRGWLAEVDLGHLMLMQDPGLVLLHLERLMAEGASPG